MKRLSILTALLLALSLLAFGTGFASAKQRTFNADPKAVWAACNTGGSYGSYDPDMGVVCVNPGCDGNANHSCIVDCNNHGQCTGTTPDRLVGVRTLGDLLDDHHKVAPAQPLDDVSDAARGLEPVAGAAASTLFAVGFLGAALLAAAVVPLSTAYSVAEGRGQVATIGHSWSEAPSFHAAFAGVVAVATAFVLIPGMPLLEVLYLSQALNAVLLLGILPLMLRLGRDPAVMGVHATGRTGRLAGAAALGLVGSAVAALAFLTITG